MTDPTELTPAEEEVVGRLSQRMEAEFRSIVQAVPIEPARLWELAQPGAELTPREDELLKSNEQYKKNVESYLHRAREALRGLAGAPAQYGVTVFPIARFRLSAKAARTHPDPATPAPKLDQLSDGTEFGVYRDDHHLVLEIWLAAGTPD